MNANGIGFFVGTLSVPVIFAAFWLFLVKLIKPLQQYPGLSYSVAAVIGWFVVFASLVSGTANIGGFAGALLVSVFAWRFYKKETLVISSRTVSRNA